jgi:hypothetical protein
LYYRNKLPPGQLPPDECVEIALWDRFGWGPEQTEKLTEGRLRIIFAILEQQRVSKDRMENLGNPDVRRAEHYISQQLQSRNAMKENQSSTIPSIKDNAEAVDGFSSGGNILKKAQ